MKTSEYKKIAAEARRKVLEMIYNAQTSHIASNFSCLDILTVLFEKMDSTKDKFIASKGWIAASVYYFLARKGIIPKKDLQRYCQPGEKEYIGLIEPHGKFGLEFAGGSMGYGLPAGAGFALAKKLNKGEGKIYILMSDGEMQVGTTWEAAMIASHHKLDNLLAIIDYNRFQAMGETNKILNIEPLKNKWETFGWRVREIDGHNFKEIEKSFTSPPPKKGKPTVIIAHTVKGSGGGTACNLFEDKIEWHYRYVDEKTYKLALALLSKEKM